MCGSGAGDGVVGPVHVNFMFRENLSPAVQPWSRDCLFDVGGSWAKSIRPLTVCEKFSVDGAGAGSVEAFECVEVSKSGVVVVGGGVGGEIAGGVEKNRIVFEGKYVTGNGQAYS